MGRGMSWCWGRIYEHIIGTRLIIPPFAPFHPIVHRVVTILTMAPGRTGKKSLATSTAAPATDTSAKPQPRTAWKTGEQLEYLLSQWPGFVSHQNSESLDRFWPRVYDTWYSKWPIMPTPEFVGKHGSLEGATLVFRSENNKVRTMNSRPPAPLIRTPENSHMVSQPGPPRFQIYQDGPTTYST